MMPPRDENLTLMPHLCALPARPADGHKGTFGTVIVVGGSETMMGAPALTASAALRGGVGLCKVATPAAVLPTVIAIEPGATGIMLGDDLDTNLHLINQADPDEKSVLAIGPGLGRSEAASDLVSSLLKGKRAIVLDADGLNLLATTGEAARGESHAGAPLILTPHPGEFERLAKPFGITASPVDPDQRAGAAAALSRVHHAVVLLKGSNTVVSDGTRLFINSTGNPAMATAGSGDVLTGLIASLLAQGLDSFSAASIGAYLHGLAGDFWAEQNGQSGLKARELADWLPRAFEKYRNMNATS